MNRKAIIVISLVDESKEKSKQQIEKEIAAELTTEPSRIPWLKKVEKVTVIEAKTENANKINGERKLNYGVIK